MSSRWRSLRWLLAIALPFALLACASRPSTPPVNRVTILHFNDLHGYLQEHPDANGRTVGGIARLIGLVNDIRQQNASYGAETVVLYAGDTLTGSTLSSAFRGQADVELLNRLAPDAAAVGNHDFDFGRAQFDKLVEDSKFPWVAANVREKSTERHALPMGMSRRFGTGSVIVVGVTTPELLTQTSPRNVKDLVIDDPVRAVRFALGRVGGVRPIRVVLSHCGVAIDKQIAREVASVDVIVGGHNQKVFDPPLVENGKWILQAGQYGERLGRMDLEQTGERLKLVRYKMYDITPEIPEDRVAKAMLDGYLARLRDRFKDVGGETRVLLDGRLETIRRGESNLGDFVCDAVRERLGVDAVLLNSGGFRASVQPGPVNVGDVQQVFPFVNTAVTMTVTGAVIRAALERGLTENPDDNPGAFLQVSGLRYQIEGRRAANIQIAGAALDEAKTYRLAVNSFMAEGGDRFDMFKNLPDAVDTGHVIADVMTEAIRQAKQIEPKTDGRIQRTAPWAP